MTPNTSALADPVTGPLLVTLTPSVAGAIVFYSLDGSAASNASTRYVAPFLLSAPFNGTLRCAGFASGYYALQHGFAVVVVPASLPTWCVRTDME